MRCFKTFSTFSTYVLCLCSVVIEKRLFTWYISSINSDVICFVNLQMNVIYIFFVTCEVICDVTGDGICDVTCDGICDVTCDVINLDDHSFSVFRICLAHSNLPNLI